MDKRCSTCLYDVKHPFGLTVKNGECSGCITHQEKYSVDWEEKKNELETVLKKYKKKSLIYDCIVPVVGDAEDFYVVSKVLELGLSPLIVSVNDYFKNDLGWHNLHQLITYFDVDSIIFNPDMRVYKDLIRTSLRKYDHILLPFLNLHTSFPIHIAYERKIPLIIWGQNQAVEQVGKFSHYDSVEMSEWSRKEHDLFGKDIEVLIGNGAQVNYRDLNYYQYPSITALSKRGIRGLYLSNYYKWDPLKQNSTTVKFGFKPQENSSSFDIYERAGSSVYYQFHDLLKFKRTGYCKVRDQLVREIRHGRISKEEALNLELKYNRTKVDIVPFLKWLGSSDSGIEWYKIHRLKGFEHLIGKEYHNQEITLPDNLKQMMFPSFKQEKSFVTFAKGISL